MSAATAGLRVPRGTQGRFIDEQRAECGLLIGGVAEVVRTLTGRDLFADLLEPISGDFDAVSAMQEGWTMLGGAAAEVERGWEDLRSGLSGRWEGVAARHAGGRLEAASRRQRRQATACRLIGDQLGHVVAVGRSTTGVVCAVLRFVDSLVQELLLDAMLGPVGAAKALVVAKGKVQRLVRLIHRGLDAIAELLRTVRAATAALRRVEVLLSGAECGLAVGNDAGHLLAGSQLASTARAGFGDDGG